MSAPRYGPGELTLAQAEITLARAAAIRDLTATGATHDEARAAVDDALRVALTHPTAQLEIMSAAWGDALDRLTEYCGRVLVPAMAAAGRGIGSLYPHLARHAATAPGHDVPADDRWAAVLERKRAGVGSGPRPPRMDGRRAA